MTILLLDLSNCNLPRCKVEISSTMTDYSARGGGGQSCVVGLHDEVQGNSNHRRRRSDYDEYSEGCYDEEDQDDDDTEQNGTCCLCLRCPAQLFTSFLLGLLACVLVTGGVFLAFHKWDHTWLLVSAVGVILMAIGTAMHCCSSQGTRKQSTAHRCKGGCAGGVSAGTRHHHHSSHKGNEIINNGSVLTEQLLPLSNARSVSQLSLNMVPGYFPPLVYSAGGAPYSLEQHSAVVQNISRLVQHQTQLHLQHSATVAQPGVDGAKGFILVPLPSQGANAASIQNIVAAVCQLDATNISTDNLHDSQVTDTAPSEATRSMGTLYENCSNNTVTATQQQVTQSISSSQPSHKHVEVQTCNEWNPPNQSGSKTKPLVTITTTDVTSASSSGIDVTSTTTAEFSCQTLETTISSSAQSPETISTAIEEPSTAQASCEQCPANDLELEEAPSVPPSESLCNSITCDNPPLVDSAPVVESTASVTDCLIDASVEVAQTDTCFEGILPLAVSSSEVCEINETPSNIYSPPVFVEIRDTEDLLTTSRLDNDDVQHSILNPTEIINETSESVPSEMTVLDTLSGHVENETTEDPLPSSDSSDFDDTELIGRSSPPPSYEDVAHETISPGGVFGTSYGTM